jgi:hypothetical protein
VSPIHFPPSNTIQNPAARHCLHRATKKTITIVTLNCNIRGARRALAERSLKWEQIVPEQIGNEESVDASTGSYAKNLFLQLTITLCEQPVTSTKADSQNLDTPLS